MTKSFFRWLTQAEFWSFEQNQWSYLLYTCIIPLVALGFITAFGAFAHPEWQMPGLQPYLRFYLATPGIYYFLPFFFYSMMCQGLLITDYHQFRQYFWVRWGIYSGFILALKYMLLGHGMIAWLAPIMFIVIVGGLWLAIVLFHLLWKALLKPHIGNWWLTLVIIAVVLLSLAVVSDDRNWLVGAGMIVVFACIFGGPVWATFFAGMQTYQLLHAKIKKTAAAPKLLLAGGYTVGLGFAIRQAIETAIIEYNKLPTTRPSDCYIATAAAKGHPSVVGSQVATTYNAKELVINTQLQRCKYVELVIKTISPSFHCRLRKYYDVWGPLLATRLTSPWLADLAYLLLKPVEWLGVGLLVLMPQQRRLVERLYKSN